MSVSIANKLAVITGASGGIGLEFCKALARRGADLLMISIDDEPLHIAAENIRKEYGVKTYPLVLNLCDADATDRIMAYMENFKLTPYILLNNAGIFNFRPLTDTPPQRINTFIDLHIRAATDLSIRFASLFKNAGDGYILNMSSMSCWMPMPGIAMYSSTKAYIRVFTRALHYEMRDYGVKVMTACPGGIATDLFGLPDNLKKLALRIGAIARPDRFAEKAVKRLLCGRMQYINGLTNRLAIVFIGILPTSIRMQIKRQLLDRGITK